MAEKLTVGVVAKRIGVRPSAVRFYERQGLLASDRSSNGYRIYDREAISILRFITRAKALGFSLEEVRQILAVRRSGDTPCTCVTSMIERNLAAIDKRIGELSALRRQLRALTKCPAPAGRRPAQAICPIIENSADHDGPASRRRSLPTKPTLATVGESQDGKK